MHCPWNELQKKIDKLIDVKPFNVLFLYTAFLYDNNNMQARSLVLLKFDKNTQCSIMILVILSYKRNGVYYGGILRVSSF